MRGRHAGALGFGGSGDGGSGGGGTAADGSAAGMRGRQEGAVATTRVAFGGDFGLGADDGQPPALSYVVAEGGGGGSRVGVGRRFDDRTAEAEAGSVAVPFPGATRGGHGCCSQNRASREGGLGSWRTSGVGAGLLLVSCQGAGLLPGSARGETGRERRSGGGETGFERRSAGGELFCGRRSGGGLGSGRPCGVATRGPLRGPRAPATGGVSTRGMSTAVSTSLPTPGM